MIFGFNTCPPKKSRQVCPWRLNGLLPLIKIKLPPVFFLKKKFHLYKNEVTFNHS